MRTIGERRKQQTPRNIRSQINGDEKRVSCSSEQKKNFLKLNSTVEI